MKNGDAFNPRGHISFRQKFCFFQHALGKIG